MLFNSLSSVLALLAIAHARKAPLANRQDSTVPPGTISDCTYFTDAQAGDSCTSIANDWGITTQDFIRYNPSVQSDCSGLVVGDSYCVEENYGQPVTTSTTTSPMTSTSTTSTSTGPPSPTQSGLTKDCTAFYDVQSGDSCPGIVSMYGTFTLDDFYSWNPSVAPDCRTLYVGVYVCVGVASTPTSRPTTTSSTATGPSPTQSGIVSNCNNYYQAVSGDSCSGIVDQYGTFTLDQFLSWNKALGSDCRNLIAGDYYCVGVPGTPTSRPTSTSSSTATGPSPTQSGIISSCTKYYQATSDDSCTGIVDKFGEFSLSDFVNWNPAVGSDCRHLIAGDYYCVAIPGTPTTRTTASSTPTSSNTGPSPTQSGIISSCTKYYQAVSGDSCSAIVDKFGTFSLDDFEKWNPAVGSDCKHLEAGDYYCIAVPGTPTSRTSSSSSPTPTSRGPQPQQPGIVDNCNRYYKVQSGQGCYDVEQAQRISADQFFNWNTGIKRDCSNLYVDNYVCTGVS